MALNFDHLLECSVCLERFTQPKVLPCQHTFCLNCLRGIAKDLSAIECPHCREEHQIPQGGVNEFKDNFMAMSFIDALSETTECYDCKKSRMLTKCEHCEKQVCADCRVAHNRLQTEITFQLHSMNTKAIILKEFYGRRNDQPNIWEIALRNCAQQEVKLEEGFAEAIGILEERREEIGRQLQYLKTYYEAMVTDSSDLSAYFLKELRISDTQRGLEQLKHRLEQIEATLSSGECAGVNFKCDISKVIDFGALNFENDNCEPRNFINKFDDTKKLGTSENSLSPCPSDGDDVLHRQHISKAAEHDLGDSIEPETNMDEAIGDEDEQPIYADKRFVPPRLRPRPAWGQDNFSRDYTTMSEIRPSLPQRIFSPQFPMRTPSPFHGHVPYSERHVIPNPFSFSVRMPLPTRHPPPPGRYPFVRGHTPYSQ